MRPDEELLGVVVHSGLVLARGQDVVAALRRITAFPAGLSLDAVVLARAVHAEAADRRSVRPRPNERPSSLTGASVRPRPSRRARRQRSGKAPQRLNGSVSASGP